ncbi:MAG TPA: metallophosphoesterase [bacterium]|nr:metallophosphoesterase [bacterium]HQG45929.1 metallophosphoesterase [bacterium]HQI48727.1 metallophosphoesterase [bacterium]HQJ63054.1 metallophosphoesterase [bacterium]
MSLTDSTSVEGAIAAEAAADAVRILFLADTHLGLDAPLRPRVQRRRRGDDFYANYLTALQPAFDRQVDLVVHGGDMFFRSRVHPSLVESAFAPLLRIADLGLPVFIVPGNHERSNIPRSLLESHPRIILFDRPKTHVLTLRGRRVALAGFPNVRDNPGGAFTQEVERTGWKRCDVEIRLLCMHQAVEGAQVGVQNYTFRGGDEVIRGSDIPAGFHAVLSGHIHRHQVLTRDLAGRQMNAPVYYPGAIERTSFAERKEEKGYLIVTVEGKGKIRHQFVPLYSRPMIDLLVEGSSGSTDRIREALIRQIAALDANAIVRLRLADPRTAPLISALNDRWLRSVAPPTMNIGWSIPWRRDQMD